MIKFNATLLAATALAQGDSKHKIYPHLAPYLCGVYFDGSHAVATNRHMMTIAHDSDGQIDKNGIYPISKKAIAAMKKKAAKNVFIRNGTLSVCAENGDELYAEPCTEIEGKFPDYHQVIPADRGGATLAGFSWTIMERVCKTQSILGGPSFRITGSDDHTAHIVSYDGLPYGYDIFSIIMPCRVGDHFRGFPDWYTPKTSNA